MFSQTSGSLDILDFQCGELWIWSYGFLFSLLPSDTVLGMQLDMLMVEYLGTNMLADAAPSTWVDPSISHFFYLDFFLSNMLCLNSSKESDYLSANSLIPRSVTWSYPFRIFLNVIFFEMLCDCLCFLIIFFFLKLSGYIVASLDISGFIFWIPKILLDVKFFVHCLWK